MKFVVGLLPAPEAEAGPLQRWVGADIRRDSQVRAAIAAFLRAHGVKTVVVSTGNLGCMHEEGLDFPLGGDCPACPFWQGRQGSRATPRELAGIVMSVEDYLRQVP